MSSQNHNPVSDLFGHLDVVEADGLTKRFGEVTVVNDVHLQVPRGTAFGYLGPNGAGKTTLIRMLLGLIRPTSGHMTLLGLPVPAKRREAPSRVGAIVDEPRFHCHMTGRQNLWTLAAAASPRRTCASTRLWNVSGCSSGPATVSPSTRWG